LLEISLICASKLDKKNDMYIIKTYAL